MRIGFIGAGKVGFTLGKYFAEHGEEVIGYYSRTQEAAEEAAVFTKSAVFASPALLIEKCNVLFFTVPDGQIRGVYDSITDKTQLAGCLLCHASGSLTAAEVFPDAEHYGASVCSLHPLSAVSDRYHAWEELGHIFFTVEGTEEKVPLVRSWLTDIGLHIQVIDGSVKTKYHCAAVIVSNQVVGLFHEAQQLFMECGFTEELAQQALAALFLGNAKHIAEAGPVQSLTGPIERGDCETVRKHLSCLEDKEDKRLYKLLSKRLLKVARQKHPERTYKELEDFLKK